MSRIAALGAYVYQAALAFGLLIAVSHVLAPSDYAAYSIFISVTQFVAIACFEWIRFACSRFYPGPDASSEAIERGTMRVELAVCSGLCGVIALGAIALGIPPVIASAAALIAIGQGATELHLTMLRFRQDFRTFSWLQGARATLVTGATLAGTLMQPSLVGAAGGSLVGYLIYLGIALAVPRPAPLERAHWQRQVVRRHLVYGGVSAFASVIGLLAPLGLKSLLTALLGAQAAAGALLALDLLQRPFVLVVNALHSVRYPDIVAIFDRDPTGRELRRSLGNYYGLLASLALLTSAGIIACLRPVAGIVVPPDLQIAFLRTAPVLVLLALLRSMTQTLMPTPAHLRQNLVAIIVLAGIDCVLMNLGAVLAVTLHGVSDLGIAVGATLGAGMAMLAGLRVVRSLPFEMDRRPVFAALAAALVPGAAYLVSTSGSVTGLAIGIAGAAGFGLLSLNGLYRASRAPSIPVSSDESALALAEAQRRHLD